MYAKKDCGCVGLRLRWRQGLLSVPEEYEIEENLYVKVNL